MDPTFLDVFISDLKKNLKSLLAKFLEGIKPRGRGQRCLWLCNLMLCLGIINSYVFQSSQM